MKRILLRSLALCLLLTACGAEDNLPLESTVEMGQQELSEKKADSAPGADVFLKVEHKVYDPSVTGYTYFITNGTEEIIEFGEDYGIQSWENGNWQELKMKNNAGFNAIGYSLEPGGSAALFCSFDIFKEKLGKGVYRLVKSIENETYYAEFELGESPYTAETPYGFGPLENLPLDYGEANAAAEDVVFTRDEVRNEKAVETFLWKVGLGAPCQLRTVQDQSEAAVMVTDVIYENDHFLWRMWSGGYVTEKPYSYIVTDGANLYLSNGADWDNTLHYGSDKAFLAPEGTLDYLVSKVEEMTEDRLLGNTVRYKVCSADGALEAMLTKEPTEFGVSSTGRGEMFDLQNWDGLETAIQKVAWQEDGTLLLTCGTVDGGASHLTFDPVSWTLH